MTIYVVGVSDPLGLASTPDDVISDDGSGNGLKAAAESAVAGDTVYLRGAYYTHSISGSIYWISLSQSGTQANPITITSYPGEWAVVRGRAATNPHPTGAYETPTPNDDERIFAISGDWWRFINLAVNDAQKHAFENSGNNNFFEYVYSQNCWSHQFYTAEPHAIAGCTYRKCEGNYNIHGTSFLMGPDSQATTSSFYTDMRIEFCISIENAHYLDGTPVPPVIGDTPSGRTVYGGGNSDGIVVTKNAGKFEPALNLMPNARYIGNIAIAQPDDGADTSCGDGSYLSRNIVINTGLDEADAVPEDHSHKGIKGFAQVTGGMHYYGNVCMTPGTNTRGFEPRADDGNQDLIGNSAVNNTAHGIILQGNTTVGTNVKNCLSTGNGSDDTLDQASTTTNHLNNSGTADIVNAAISTIDYASMPGRNFAIASTTAGDDYKSWWERRYRYIQDQVVAAIMPTYGGNLYRAGTYDASAYSATAADDPVSPSDPEADLMPWTGTTNPDIGAIAYRLINPPTRLIVT